MDTRDQNQSNLHLATGHLKGLCHSRHMRALMRNILKSLAQLFQIPSESSGSCFICLNRVHLRKVRCFYYHYNYNNYYFYLQTFLSIYRNCLLRYFCFCNGGKTKNPTTSSMQISLNWTLLRMCPS